MEQNSLIAVEAQSTKLIRRRGACERCKNKKARCDGLRPVCSTCTKAGRTVCHYSSRGTMNRQRRSSTGQPTFSSDLVPQDNFPEEVDFINQLLTERIPWSSLSTEPPNRLSNETLSSETESPTGMVDFTPELLDSDTTLTGHFLDLDPNGYSPAFYDLCSMNTSTSDQAQELAGYPSSNWPKDREPLSLAWKLSQRLFPGASNARPQNFDHFLNIDKARNEFDLDSSILSIALTNLTVAPSTNSSQLLPVYTSLVGKLRQQSLKPVNNTSSGILESDISTQTSTSILQTYIDAFFDHPFSCYLTPEDVHKWFTQYLRTTSTPQISVGPIVNAILAIGCRIICKRHSTTLSFSADQTVDESKAAGFFSAALAARGQLFQGTPSIFTLQSLLTMAIYLQDSSEEMLTCSIISQTVQQAVELGIHKSQGIWKLSHTEQESRILRRLFWVVYSIETPLMLRLNRYSFVEDRLIDYAPDLDPQENARPETTDKQLFLLHSAQYAKICSVIRKSLYSFTVAKSRSEIIPIARQVQGLLNEWEQCLPEAFRILPLGFRPPLGMTQDQTQCRMHFTVKYHEAMLIIYQRGEICTKSAQWVLSLTHLLEDHESRRNWTYYRFFVVAYLIVLLDISEARHLQTTKTNMSLLFLANSWFGRLALSEGCDVGFEELMDLSHVAQTIWKTASISGVQENR